MRVAIAGAGAVGRSIAAELLSSGHEVLLIDRDSRAIDVHALTEAEWLLADACEVSSLENARLEEFDAVRSEERRVGKAWASACSAVVLRGSVGIVTRQ